MKKRYTNLVAAVALACSVSNVTIANANTTADHNKEIIGYITNWDPWKSTNAGFPAKGVANHLNVDMSKFTILNYSFFGVAVDGSLHSGDHRNKNIYKESEVQQPAELLMTDIYSSWDMHLMFGELSPSYTLTDEAKAQGFTANGQTWTHEGYGLSGGFPIPVKKAGGKPGIIEHAHANGVKVMASIGGWSMCKHFPEMAADPAKRAKFMADVRRLMALGFDGIDLDWEYPGPYSGMNFTGTEADYGNFLTLVKEIRAEIGPDKLITAAFSADYRKLDGFDWVELDKYMDYYNMMTYDFNGGWSNIAGHNAPVHDYTGSEVPFFNWDTLSQWMINRGIDTTKINMGFPFYGRGVVTENPADINAPTIKRNITIQPDGPISSAADYDHWKDDVYNGTPNYFFVEQNKAGWTKAQDTEAQVPYFTKNANGKSYFLSYDDVDSIGYKAQYVNDYNLGGAIVWTVAGDLECTGGVTTHSGKLATCANVNQPLANKINQVFATGAVGTPNVVLTSPSAGDVFTPGSNITISANASDSDGTVVSVEFLANGTSVGLDTTAPYSVDWTNVAMGDYSIVAKATDNAGNVKETPALSISVNEDHLKPVVAYTGPSGDLSLDPLAPISLSATASYDAGTITTVEFNVNGTVIAGSMTSGNSYTATYNPAAYGEHTVTVSATNDAGYTGTATGMFNITACDGEPWDPSKVYTTEKVTYKGKLYQSRWWNTNEQPDISQVWQYIKDCGGVVDPVNQAPIVGYVQPDAVDFAVGSNVTLSADAVDNDGTVVNVDFYVNDAMVGSDTTKPYSTNWSAAKAGSYTVKAVATDDKGATGEATSRFTVSDGDPIQAPIVTITNPANGVEFTAGEVVNLSAEATDTDGTVVDVSFTIDDKPVAVDTTAPYSAEWTAVTGNYTLFVTATDDTGNSTTESVTFAVVDDVNTCTVSAWEASKVYNGGDQASYQGKVYQARWWSQGDNPTASTDDWYVWFVVGDCK